jgi:hypothetical protein
LLILSLPSAVELTMQLTPPCVSKARTGKSKYKKNQGNFSEPAFLPLVPLIRIYIIKKFCNADSQFF